MPASRAAPAISRLGEARHHRCHEQVHRQLHVQGVGHGTAGDGVTAHRREQRRTDATASGSPASMATSCPASAGFREPETGAST
jgi:hypothetical protein